jgi:transcriptional regulator with XRE-family HTH domain
MQAIDATSAQLRAARSAVGWTVRELAKRSAVGEATIKRYEASPSVPKSRKGNLQAIMLAYESAGIEFIGAPDDSPGIRIHLPKPDARK